MSKKRMFLNRPAFLRTFLILIILSLMVNCIQFTCLAVGPVTYYISSVNGSDSNNGLSSSTPWAGFANIPTLNPGDTVCLERGSVWNTTLVLSGEGTSTNYITLTDYGTASAAPKIAVNSCTAGSIDILINSPSYWNISNLDCRNSLLGIYLRYLNDYSNHNVNITNCYFQNMQDPTDLTSTELGDRLAATDYQYTWPAGIMVGGKADYDTTSLSGLTVRDCMFDDCNTGLMCFWYWPNRITTRVTNIEMADCKITGTVNGLFQFDEASTVNVHDCIVKNGSSTHGSCSGTSGAFLQTCNNVTIQGCEFSGVQRLGTYSDGVGIDFEGNNTNCTINECVFHDNAGAGIEFCNTYNYNTGISISNTVLYNNCLNPYNSSNAYEFLPWSSFNTGTLSNVSFYRASSSIGYISSYGTGFSETGCTHSEYSTVSGRAKYWVWSADNDALGWHDRNDWTSYSVCQGALWGASAGNDMYIYSPNMFLSANTYNRIQIYMHCTSGVGKIYFITQTDSVWNEAKSVTFNYEQSWNFGIYTIDMSQNTYWHGVITGIRLDPTWDVNAAFGMRYLSTLAWWE